MVALRLRQRVWTMELSGLVRDKRDEILSIAKAHGAMRVRVFGSFARVRSGPKAFSTCSSTSSQGDIFSISSP